MSASEIAVTASSEAKHMTPMTIRFCAPASKVGESTCSMISLFAQAVGQWVTVCRILTIADSSDNHLDFYIEYQLVERSNKI